MKIVDIKIMVITQDQKYTVDRKIVNKAIDCLEKEEITKDQLMQIADFVLGNLKNVKKDHDLVKFYKQLSSNWPIFEGLAIIETGKGKTAVESEVYNGVLTLAKHGKIDDAVKLARSITTK